MRNNLFFLTCLSMFLLAGCAWDKPIINPNRPTIAALPPVEQPQKPKITPWKYDWPRVCNAVPCQKAAPVDTQSNLLIGFTQTEWVKFQQGQNEVNAYIRALLLSLEAANKRLSFPDTPEVRKQLNVVP